MLGPKPGAVIYFSKPLGLAFEAGGSSEVATGGGRYRSGHCSPASLSEHPSDRHRWGEQRRARGRVRESAAQWNSPAGVYSHGF